MALRPGQGRDSPQRARSRSPRANRSSTGVLGFEDTRPAPARARAHRRPRRDLPRRARPGQDPDHPLARRAPRRVDCRSSPARRSTTTRTTRCLAYARDLVADSGDDTPITWVHRSDRYGEKLATPDTSIADLIGEVDPIKVAEGRYLSDELTIHYGLVPRTNRGIFAINELPDLAERIQVGLLNVLEERDVQIRGHTVRLPLDILLVASANPEDYTNRGRIITPLKDRFGAQIRTHYPHDVETEVAIVAQEARVVDGPRRPARDARRSWPRSSRGSASSPAEPAGEPALRRLGAPERRQPRDARRRRHPPGAAARRDRGGATGERPRRARRPRRSASSRSRRSKKDEDEEVVDKLINAAVLQTFREHCPTETLGEVVGGFDDGKVVHAGPDLSSADYVAHAGGTSRHPKRRHRAQRRHPRARPRSPAPSSSCSRASTCPSVSTRTRQGRGRHTGRDRAATWRTSSTRVGTALRPASTSTRTRSWRRSTTTCSTTATSDAALRRLLQQGFQDRNGRHVEGMQELLERIRERRRQEREQHDLGGVYEDIANELNEILDQRASGAGPARAGGARLGRRAAPRGDRERRR